MSLRDELVAARDSYLAALPAITDPVERAICAITRLAALAAGHGIISATASYGWAGKTATDDVATSLEFLNGAATDAIGALRAAIRAEAHAKATP